MKKTAKRVAFADEPNVMTGGVGTDTAIVTNSKKSSNIK